MIKITYVFDAKYITACTKNSLKMLLKVLISVRTPLRSIRKNRWEKLKYDQQFGKRYQW